jgi:hypothetical protein
MYQSLTDGPELLGIGLTQDSIQRTHISDG